MLPYLMRSRAVQVGLPIALTCGFWYSLPRACPAWIDLMRRVGAVPAITSEKGWLAKGEAFEHPEPATAIGTAVGIALACAFYWAKLAIPRLCDVRIAAMGWYILLASVATAYLYLEWEDWDNPHVELAGNWLGAPVMLLFVPTLSFLYDMFAGRSLSWRFLAIRSLAECLIAIPLWTYVWIVMSMLLGLMWI